MPNQRIETVKALEKILENKLFFNELKTQITSQHLPFANMVVLTTLRFYTPLKKLLNSFLQKKIPHKHCFAEYALLSAMAEILFMDTPHYAVVNETVNNISKNTDKFLGRLANSVLRKVSEHSAKYKAQITEQTCLSPEFIQLLSGYSNEEIKKIDNCIKIFPPLDITVKNNPIAWAERLQGKVLPNGTVRLSPNVKVTELEGFADGQWWVQDAAASLPVMLAGDIKGKTAVDLCAAPGGKTAQLLAAGAKVTAVDINAARLNKLSENMQRLKFAENLKIVCDDAVHFLQQTSEKFDIILLDAPCSATGTFRRHPEIMHIKSIEDVNKLTILQKELLNNCANALKIGGILIYCVCSITKQEGEQQIADFLHNNNNFKRVPTHISTITSYGEWSENFITESGDIRTMPYFCQEDGGMDSFFICKMQRII